MKPTVGLTGGIASGKSTVARMFAELGVGVVDADAIAREIVAPGTEGLAEIVQTFGAGVLDGTGALDRKRLGAIVFADATARAKLNAITHPRIGALSAARIAELQDTATPYVIYEAALLVEGGLYRALAALIVVVCDEAQQRARIVDRDQLDEDEAAARIQAQLPTAQKVAVADFVIENRGDLDALRRRTEEVHYQLLQRFAATP